MSRSALPIFCVGSAASRLSSGDDERHSHAVQLYAEDASLVDAVARFVAEALDAGEAAVIVATAEHRRELDQNLNARGVDMNGAARQGRYVALDAADSLSLFMVEGWPNAERFASRFGDLLARARAATANPHSNISVFGEMVALLWAEGKPEAAIQLEKMWNDLSRTQFFHLRCAYSIGAFDRPEQEASFLRMCGEHSRVIPISSHASSVSDDAWIRSLAHLHQKASLEVEAVGRKKLQEALQQRESELVDLLENAVEGVQRSSSDQKVQWANKALLNLLGYTAEEYVGHCFADFYVASNVAHELWAKLMRREEVYDFPAEMRCKDGSIKNVLIHSNGLWDGQQFVHTRTFIHDVTERKQMEQALKQAHDELELRVAERTAELRKKNHQISQQAEMLDRTNHGLRQLSARLMQAQDDERRRIARDLHDSTGQTLALLGMNLSALETEAGRFDSRLAEGLAENAAIVRQISTELRTLSYILHPPLLDEMGLESALRWYAEGFAQRSNIGVHLELPEGWERFSNEMEIAIFRVVQECLTNIHRHSGSATATIRLCECSGDVILEVTDEGRGITPERLSQISSVGAPGVGLRGMRERIKDFGGELEIMSDEKGTRVKMVVPEAATLSRL